MSTRKKRKQNHAPESISEKRVATLRNYHERKLEKVFKIDAFKEKQWEIIEWFLDHSRAFAILPTGFGKSLLFQYLALHVDGLVVVIEPLIALMLDQVREISDIRELRQVGLLSSHQRAKDNSNILASLDTYKILFVAPERVMDSKFQEAVRDRGVGLVVIDEVHAMSQFAYHFRSSYLYLRNIQDLLNPKKLLAMTATATIDIEKDISKWLNIEKVFHHWEPKTHLQITMIQTKNRFDMIAKLLKGKRFQSCIHDGGTIIYCHRRQDAELISQILKEEKIQSLVYHAGMGEKKRTANQEMFFADKVKVICSTISFGMGINKPNIRSVIHFSIPTSIESYVQEIGRAGRDGKLSLCHLFYDENDFIRQRSLAHSTALDLLQIVQFLRKITSTPTSENILPIKNLELEMDISEYTMETIFAYLALELKCIDVQSPVCNLHVLHIPVANMDHPLIQKYQKQIRHQDDKLLTLELEKNQFLSTIDQFKKDLSELFEIPGCKRKATESSFHLKILKEFDDLVVAKEIKKHLDKIVEANLKRLHQFQELILEFISKGKQQLTEQEWFQGKIQEYFVESKPYKSIDISHGYNLSQLRNDCKKLMQRFEFPNPRVLCRIFHGISSPKYQSAVWSRSPFWRRYERMHFHQLHEMVTNICMNRSPRES